VCSSDLAEQVVTLRGRYFNSAAGTVTRDGVPLKALAWSATEIRVLVPAGTRAGAAPFLVTNSDGLRSAAGPVYTVAD
jgi:hypothetical protein